MKRIVLLFDGTWNAPQSQTNVFATYQALAGVLHGPNRKVVAQESGITEQVACYYSGVGTRFMQWFTGGAFGRGLSQDILQGYADLCGLYRPGDQIFLFGFSRGAYSARSLAGLIRKCGILIDSNDDLLRQAYKLYRSADPLLHPDSQTPESFRRTFAHADICPIEFIGVWDTVGALGIPTSAVIPGSRQRYQFHDVALSKIVRHAYHALALDEHREDYRAALWTQVPDPEGDPFGSQERCPVAKDGQVIEQCWFIGAHANVGGGYPDDPLASIPLAWITHKAHDLGLQFEELPQAIANTHLTVDKPHDSYAEFLKGGYKLVKRRYIRLYGTSIGEDIHPSVVERWQAREDYRPRSLVNHPQIVSLTRSGEC